MYSTTIAIWYILSCSSSTEGDVLLSGLWLLVVTSMVRACAHLRTGWLPSDFLYFAIATFRSLLSPEVLMSRQKIMMRIKELDMLFIAR